MIIETFQTLAMHIARANQAYEEIIGFSENLSEEDLDDFDKVKVIDSFVFRFIKVQDLMGNKLFKEVLMLLGEYEPSMSMLDVLDRMEKLLLLNSAETWLEYRNLRNILTHEYPDNRNEILSGIHEALSVYGKLKLIYQNIFTYMQHKKLIEE